MEKDLSFIDELIKKGVIKIVEKLNDELTNKPLNILIKVFHIILKDLICILGKLICIT